MEEILMWFGKHSLETYLLHGFVLNIIKLQAEPEYLTSCGIMLVAVNYCITILLVRLIVTVLNANGCLKVLLFGKEH